MRSERYLYWQSYGAPERKGEVGISLSTTVKV